MAWDTAQGIVSTAEDWLKRECRVQHSCSVRMQRQGARLGGRGGAARQAGGTAAAVAGSGAGGGRRQRRRLHGDALGQPGRQVQAEGAAGRRAVPALLRPQRRRRKRRLRRSAARTAGRPCGQRPKAAGIVASGAARKLQTLKQVAGPYTDLGLALRRCRPPVSCVYRAGLWQCSC